MLQAATGIGFGIIAGPIILMVMNSGSAIQVSILLSLLIALVLTPSLHRQADRRLLGRLLLGTALGLPLGIFVFLQVSIDVLKLLAGLAVLFMALNASGVLGLAPRRGRTRRGELHNIGIGVISGTMCSSLAMPGPVVAARMTVLALPKETIRATILVMFVFSYTAAMGFQATLAGVARETLVLTATLAPATLLGVALGRLSVAWISERLFRRILILVLAATAASLLFVSLRALLGAN